MDNFNKVLIFTSFVAFSSAQTCIKPTLMTTFKIAEYSTGKWFTIAGKATMNTPLTAACSTGTCNNNGSHLLCNAESIVDGKTSAIPIVAKAVGGASQGVFSWAIPQYNVGLMTVKDLAFTYTVLFYDAQIACVYITGTVQKVMSINIVMIQARAKTIDDATYKRAIGYFSKCKLGTSSWTKVNQVSGCP